MPTRWSMADYALTDAIYHKAALRAGGAISHRALLAQCQAVMPERDLRGLWMHMGQLTKARADLGLPIMPLLTCAAPVPRKLQGFLQRKYGNIPDLHSLGLHAGRVR